MRGRSVHRVDLWLWRLEGGDMRSLAQDERARAARFVYDRDRLRYIAARAQMRKILGRYLRRPPDSLQFSYGPAGKPELPGVCFNLTHSNDLAALVVGQGIDLGVDIEAVRPVEEAVARQYFASEEYAALQRVQDEDWLICFHRCWTRKEAYVKARGIGLGSDTRAFTVSIGREPQLIGCSTGEAALWTLLDIPLPPGYVGAVAVRAAGVPVTLARMD